MADMAHVAGLIAAGVAKNPLEYGFHVMTTTSATAAVMAKDSIRSLRRKPVTKEVIVKSPKTWKYIRVCMPRNDPKSPGPDLAFNISTAFKNLPHLPFSHLLHSSSSIPCVLCLGTNQATSSIISSDESRLYTPNTPPAPKEKENIHRASKLKTQGKLKVDQRRRSIRGNGVWECESGS
jgi:hypothetical protein